MDKFLSPKHSKTSPSGKSSPVFDWSPLPQKRTLVYSKDNQQVTEESEDLYPNCDGSVWLRSCEIECKEPLEGTIKGEIPQWLNGVLIRNGPGSLKVGNNYYEHLFDSSALLHRFAIKNGKVTYQCRFLQTDVYKRNWEAKRIVFNEFGTKAVPDPCQTIFQKYESDPNLNKPLFKKIFYKIKHPHL